MFRSSLLVSVLVAFTCASFAQSACPTTSISPNLACVIPQIYGPGGLDPKNPDWHKSGTFGVHFLTSSLNALQSSISRQSTVLPLASPSSGVTFQWDSAAKVYQESTDSYGPILGDRADTIGRYRLFVGFAYQHFNFTRIDGFDMNSLPVVLKQDATLVNGAVVCSIDSADSEQNFGPTAGAFNDGHPGCGYIRDVIRTENKFNLKIHQFTTFLTFGLTNRIDVSAAIPIESVRFGMTSKATISINDSPADSFYDPNDLVNSPGPLHAFPSSSGCPAPCLVQSFPRSETAAGIGDITLRVKAAAWKGERAGLAIGADIRTPTGDSLNYLGAGAAGVRPFIIWSYRARMSPHVFVGYDVNANSLIAGDVTTGAKAKVPGDLAYAGGVDVWLNKRITAAVDLVGQELFSAQRTKSNAFTEPGICQDDTIKNNINCSPDLKPIPHPSPDPNLSGYSDTFNISSVSLGAKIRPGASLLITGNVLLRLNDSGLRSDAIPLVGVSYTF